ncbi:MAG: hypothetical protein AABY16_04155 [Nanoarchaeota archaeon]
MKSIVWTIVALVIFGGIAWFFLSDNSESDTQQTDSSDDVNVDELSVEGRVLETDDNVFSEIDDAVNDLE